MRGWVRGMGVCGGAWKGSESIINRLMGQVSNQTSNRYKDICAKKRKSRHDFRLDNQVQMKFLGAAITFSSMNFIFHLYLVGSDQSTCED